MDLDPNAPPLNPLPPVVWLFALPLIGVELAIQLQAAGLLGAGGLGWREALFRDFALFPEFLRLQWETGGYPVGELYRLASYPLIHARFVDALFVVVLFLALGKMVGEAFSAWAVILIVLAATAVGGVTYGLLVPEVRAPLIGGTPPVYGLIGAFTYLMLTRLGQSGQNRLMAFRLIGFLLLVQLVFAVAFGGSQVWVAEVTGFVVGFALSFVVNPGGTQRLIAWLRQR